MNGRRRRPTSPSRSSLTGREAPPDSEERLAVEAAQRDPSRFADLYENHFDRVYAFVLRRVSDRTEAEDLTSDVFHKALANIGSFEWRGVPFAAWLLRIAANVIVDRSKRGAREIAGIDDPGEPVTQPNLDEVDRHARLFRLVERLPADQRRVIALRFAEEFWRAFATNGAMTLHLRMRSGKNPHHVLEASFKAVARCLRDAVRVEGDSVPSTKGTL